MPQRFGIRGVVDIPIEHRIDIRATSLQEEGDGTVAYVVFNDSGGKAAEVCGVGAAGHALDGVAGEIIEDGQGLSVLLVQPQDADLRIDRADRGDLFVGRERVGAADIRFTAIFEFEPAVFHDPVLVAGADADCYRHHMLPCGFYGLDRPRCDIFADHAVAVAGVDQHMRRIDCQLFLQLGPHIGQIVVADGADLADRHGVHGDEDHRGMVTAQD